MNNKIIGTIFVLFGSVCWGAGGVAGQSLLAYDDISAMYLVAVRLLFSGVLLLAICLISNFKKTIAIWETKRNAVDIVIYSLAGIMLCQLSFYTTIKNSNAGTATILQYIAPIIILAVTCIRERRIPSFAEVFCMILAVSGVFLLATHGHIDKLVISPKALAAGILTAVTVVLYTMQPARLLEKHSAVVLLAWAMTIAGALLCSVLKVWQNVPVITTERILLFLFVTIVGTILSFTAYMKGVTLVGAAKASLYSGVEPIVAVILSAVLLDTAFAPADIVGFVLIVVAIFVLTIQKNK